MTTIQTRNASIYWGSGAAAPTRVAETRNVTIALNSDFVDDTVHGDTNRSFAPLFSNFDCKVTGLLDVTATTGSVRLITDAGAATSGTFYIYIGQSTTYFYGSGYVSVDEVGAPYDEFAPFNWSIRPIGTVTYKQN